MNTTSNQENALEELCLVWGSHAPERMDFWRAERETYPCKMQKEANSYGTWDPLIRPVCI